MNKLGHILFSTLIFTITYIIISNYFELDVYKILFTYFLFLIYSLIPDIDKNNSWIRKKIDKIIIILAIIFTIISIINNDQIAFIITIILLVLELFLTIVKHRGPIHTITFGIICASPLLFVGELYFFAGILGVITHLIADKI